MNEQADQKYFLQVLKNKPTTRVPFWFMRQAGRYLPEYRELRKTAGGFLDLVYNPEMASEVTMQPIRRFGMDVAILFSDILVIPQALGQALRFETGEGPKLDALKTAKDLGNLNGERLDDILHPIYETISLTALKLKSENYNHTALVGFAGSPWTVACYMIEGGGSKTFEKTKIWASENPETFQNLMDILIQSTSHYLIKQIEAGVEAIQLFDSWAGILDESGFNDWVIAPTIEIIKQVRQIYPEIPIIGFPRKSGDYSITYAQKTNIDAIGLDYSMEPNWARDNLQNLLPVQGNLDPKILLEGGENLEKQTTKILETFSDKPFVFNLGHGIIKETPPEHVEKLCSIIRNFKL